jgi:hypothetical protein
MQQHSRHSLPIQLKQLKTIQDDETNPPPEIYHVINTRRHCVALFADDKGTRVGHCSSGKQGRDAGSWFALVC